MKRMFVISGCLLATMLLWTGMSGAGALKGVVSDNNVMLPGTAQGGGPTGVIPGQLRITERFAGGERASVILRGDHDPVEDLTIEVYDENNNLVAKDDGRGDYATVVWYPPEDGNYTIVLKHDLAQFNKCFLVIK